jgi:glucose/arabinose dehydrogenase
MIRSSLILGATVLFATSIGAHAISPNAADERNPPAQQPPATPPATAPANQQGVPPGQGGQAGRGAPGGQPARGRGGRGNPMADKFTTVCATCHGTSPAKGPVGPSLFAATWIHGGDDDSIVKSIKDGYPEKGMPAFKDQMTDPEIWQMLAYIRTQTQNLKDKPVYVPDPDGQIIKSEKVTYKMEVVARNLETPWALAFLPDGRLLITERPGRLRIVENGKLLDEPVKGMPKVWEKQDGGLFDVEVHPDYKNNGWIYISYSETLPGWTPPPPPPTDPNAPAAPPAGQGQGPGGGGRGRGPSNDPPSMTVIMRGRLKNNEFVDQEVLFRAPKALYSQTNAHYGSRFLFDTQNHLFFTLGEKQQMMDAQDLSKPTGKILRINDDGTIPKDNPYVGQPNVWPAIWSYGHRNPQGLAWDPVTGQLWESEHGPTGGDEINIISPKHNYGWGVVSKGIQQGITKTSEPGMDDPVTYWTPSVAPSGIAFYTGDKYPGWKNNLFVSCLAGQQLKRLEIKDGKVLHEEQVFNQFGRVHDVIQGPDGLLYVTLQLPGQVLSQSTPGMVARLVPVRQ